MVHSFFLIFFTESVKKPSFLRFSTAHRKETLEKKKRKKWLLKKVGLYIIVVRMIYNSSQIQTEML